MWNLDKGGTLQRSLCHVYPLLSFICTVKQENLREPLKHQTKICCGESRAAWQASTLIHIEEFDLIYRRLCQPLKRPDVTQTARWPHLLFHFHRCPLSGQSCSSQRNPKTTQWHNDATVPFSPLHNFTITLKYSCLHLHAFHIERALDLDLTLMPKSSSSSVLSDIVKPNRIWCSLMSIKQRTPLQTVILLDLTAVLSLFTVEPEMQ